MEFYDEICYEKLNNFARSIHAFLALNSSRPDITTCCYLKASFETDFGDICNHFKDNKDEDMMKLLKEMKAIKDEYLEIIKKGLFWNREIGFHWKKTSKKKIEELEGNLQETEKRNTILQNDIRELETKLQGKEEIIKLKEEQQNHLVAVLKVDIEDRKSKEKGVFKLADELAKDNESLWAKIKNLNKQMGSEPLSKIEKANSRANVIVRDCNNLYENKYSIAKEEFAKNGCNEKVVEEWFLEIFMECFKETKELVEISKTKVKDSFKDQLLQHPFSNDEKEFPHQIEINISEMLQEKPNPSILENLSQKIFVRYTDILNQENTSKSFKNFIDEAVYVTSQMNTCNPPMCLSVAGKTFNTSRHICMGGRANHIERFLWPCIYMSEQEYDKGEVLQRGYVVKGDCSVNAIESEAK